MVNVVAFEVPSELAWRRRQSFYSCRKNPNESIKNWYKRIEKSLDGCDYGNLKDFMFIDKFITGLNYEVFERLVQNKTLNVEKLVSITIPQEPSKIELRHESISSDNSVKYTQNPSALDHTLENPDNSFDIFENNIFKSESIENNEESLLMPIECVLKVESDDEQDKEHETNTVKLLGYKNIGDNRAICLDCGKNIALSSKTDHRRIHTGRLLTCDICRKVFNSLGNFKRHLKTHEETGQTFECHLCGYNADRFLSLRCHFTSKHCSNFNAMKKQLHCTLCDKLFTSQNTLNIHMRIHEGLAENHKCPHCDKVFDQRKRLTLHQQIHSNVKSCVCEICGKSFRFRSSLRKHKQSHSDKREFECKECGHLLKNGNSLRIHMRIHTGEKPYKCSNCSKAFSQRGSYLRHLFVHGGEKPYSCQLCDKRFATPYRLERHMSVHTGAKPYSCNLCEKSFTQSTTLRSHQRKEHPIDFMNKK